MGAQPAASWRRLAPLVGIVLAAHFALLQWHPVGWRPGGRVVATFSTRTIALPAPPPAAVAPPAAIEQAPAPPKPNPKPPRPRAVAPIPREPPVMPAEPTSTPTPPPSSVPQPLSAPVLIPSSMHLHYTVQLQARGLQLAGEADLDWRQDGAGYEARLELRSPGLPSRIQRSTGAITPEGLAPSYFSDKARNELATHFDREHDRLVFSNNHPDAALAAGMQDRLSVVLQLSALLAGDPARYPPGTQMTIPTASARDADDWTFAVIGEEELVLPGGTVRALKLQRLPRKDYDQRVELWLAPGLDYAPLRLRLTNPNGDAADLRWSSTDRPQAAPRLN